MDVFSMTVLFLIPYIVKYMHFGVLEWIEKVKLEEHALDVRKKMKEKGSCFFLRKKAR